MNKRQQISFIYLMYVFGLQKRKIAYLGANCLKERIHHEEIFLFFVAQRTRIRYHGLTSTVCGNFIFLFLFLSCLQCLQITILSSKLVNVRSYQTLSKLAHDTLLGIQACFIGHLYALRALVDYIGNKICRSFETNISFTYNIIIWKGVQIDTVSRQFMNLVNAERTVIYYNYPYYLCLYRFFGGHCSKLAHQMLY